MLGSPAYDDSVNPVDEGDVAKQPVGDDSVGRMQFMLTMRRRGIGDAAVLRALDEVPVSPTIDDQGLLWVGRRWVDLTPAQAPVVGLLVEHLERVVAYEAVVTAYERAGGSSHAASVRTLLTRIGRRVRPVGLDLVTVRRRGVLLTQRPRVAAG